ncbi:MAG: MT-A70 family methyltransferase [Candidatus Heimdallarchaeota archaeon]
MEINKIKIRKRFRKDIGELETLKNSIKEIGLLQPIVVDEKNNLIAGQRRLLACKELGWKEIDVNVVKINDILKGEYDENVVRKQFLPTEMIAIKKAIEPLKKKEAEKRMKIGRPSSNLDKGRTDEKIAKGFDIGRTTLLNAEKVIDFGDKELIEKMDETGNVNDAYQEVKRREKLKAVEEKAKEFKGRKQKDSFTDIYATKNKYNIILADPAWSYFTGGRKNQSLHYKGMTIEEICEVPVKNIADENCILFLWVTFPILDKAFEVIKAWGFTYSTCGFNWIKKNKNKDSHFLGLGSWTRSNSELCLIATKGKTERIDRSVSQVIEAPIEEHSKKPDIVREKIVQLVGKLPRIELFSRQPVKGWDNWGLDNNLTN